MSESWLARSLSAGAAAARGPALAAVLGREAGVHLALKAVGSLLVVSVEALIARRLGVEGYGRYAIALTVVQVLAVGAQCGLDGAAVRFAASLRAQESWSRLRGFVRFAGRTPLLLGAGVALLAAGVVAGLRARLDGELVRVLWVGCLAVPGLALLTVACGILQGLRRVALARLADSIVRPLLLGALALGTLPLARRHGVVWTMAALVGAVSLAAAAAQGLVRRHLPPAVWSAPPESCGREWLRASLPLLFISGLRALNQQADILLVGGLVGTTAAGIFVAASRLSGLMTYGYAAVNVVAAPMMAELHAREDRSGVERVVRLASWAATLASLGAAAVLVVGGPRFLRVFGDHFASGTGVLLALAAGQLVNAVTGPVGILLNMTGHQGDNARILTWITLANLALSVPAILLWGPVGTAAVTGVLTAVKNIWTYRVVRRRLGIHASILAWSR